MSPSEHGEKQTLYQILCGVNVKKLEGKIDKKHCLNFIQQLSISARERIISQLQYSSSFTRTQMKRGTFCS